MMPPLISVIIPMYNNRNTIQRTINSVLSQSYRNLEIIVIDDGSDDDSCKIVKEINDDRIQLFSLSHNNANVARNYGIKKSTGDYIAMLDADDEWLKNHIEKSFYTLQEAKVDGIYGSVIVRSKTDRLIETRKIKEDESTIDFLLTNGYAAQTSTLFLTSSSIKDILWDETLYRHQDYDFIVRFLKKYRMCPKLEATTIYHVSNSNLKSKIDFDSCIRFITKVRNDISDRVYTAYNKHMLRLSVYLSADDKIISYYKKEVNAYAYLLSYYEYISLFEPKGVIEYYVLKFKYLWEISFCTRRLI